jgi:hypothetical protein
MVGEEILISAISTVGFPIVAFYLMYNLTRDTIAKNTDALNELKEVIISKKE